MVIKNFSKDFYLPVLLSIGVLLLTCSCSPDPEHIAVEIRGAPLTLQLALEEETRSRGLGNLDEIPPLTGMLFVYSSPRELHFAMTDCRFEIDIAFLNREGIVVALHEMSVEAPRSPSETQTQYLARLPRYSSGEPAQFVIELRGGMIRKLGLATGEAIEFPRAELARLAD